jgi:hypothetical protein
MKNKDFKVVLQNLSDRGKYIIHSTSRYEDIPCLSMRACLMFDALMKIYGGKKKLLKILFEQVNIDIKYGQCVLKNNTLYRNLCSFYNEHKNAFRKK